ncbi:MULTISPECIES: phage head closure protein [Bacillus cereus group]|uniref:phage head closure protein n=1 Tax=Bacillus cereus group TaxID=86661 RepID=UPI0022E45F39|nr:MULTISPECIES: phage head closure protein [Bacillus cereus group]MDA1620154.1 phage head closure protein [Bacillus cereus group sp. TH204-1LC]MDK7476335.1 phage head closure protein [Bacillus paranthracis]
MNDILFFPVVTTTKDDLGQIEVSEDFTRQVFCEKKSISQNEFFQAGQNGFKPKCVLIVYSLDYQEEQKVQYNNKTYIIYRTYERDDERIELYCEVKAGG